MRIATYMALFMLAIGLVLLSGCDLEDNNDQEFNIFGTVENTAGFAPTGLEVSAVDDDGFIAGGGIVQSDGDFTILPVPPGTYTLVTFQTLNGVPVRTESGPVTVTNNDISVPTIIVPVAADLAALGTPVNAALAVFVRDANQQVLPAIVQISGVSGTFGPDAPVLISNIPTGRRNVTVFIGNQTLVRQDVSFIAGTITVLNFNVGQLVGAFTVTGSVVNSTGGTVSGIPVSIFRNDALVTTQNVPAGGAVSFTGQQPGVFQLRTTLTFNSVPVDVFGGFFSVTNADVTAPRLVLPTAQDVGSIGTPTNGALIVFARDSNNLPVTATVQIAGVSGTFGPGSTVTVPNVATGTRIVTVTSGTQTVIIPAATFTAGRITVLNAVF